MSAARPTAKRKQKPSPVSVVPDPEPDEPERPAVDDEPMVDDAVVNEPVVNEAVVAEPASATGSAGSAATATGAAGDETSGRDEDVPEVGARPNAWAAPMNALGGFIRAQRQLAKLSLRDMATMTSVSNAYLSQVERGLHQPSLKVLHSIADALQLSTEQLLSQAGWATHTNERSGAANGGTEEAIRTDPRLTPEQRTALLGVYRSFVDGTA